jgi:hypothetical protein
MWGSLPIYQIWSYRNTNASMARLLICIMSFRTARRPDQSIFSQIGIDMTTLPPLNCFWRKCSVHPLITESSFLDRHYVCQTYPTLILRRVTTTSIVVVTLHPVIKGRTGLTYRKYCPHVKTCWAWTALEACQWRRLSLNPNSRPFSYASIVQIAP